MTNGRPRRFCAKGRTYTVRLYRCIRSLSSITSFRPHPMRPGQKECVKTQNGGSMVTLIAVLVLILGAVAIISGFVQFVQWIQRRLGGWRQ